MKTGSLESQAKCGNVHCDWFIPPLLLANLTIWFSLDCKQHLVIRGVRRKWKRSDSSDPDSVALMTPIFFIFTRTHKHSYDSDSITSENQLLKAFLPVKRMNGREITNTAELKKKILFIAGKFVRDRYFKWASNQVTDKKKLTRGS